MWWLWLILSLIFIKLYNKSVCGWCYARNIMTGKVVIVTGANAGIGFETAFNMARRGAKVYLACRDDARGAKAVEEIVSRTGNKHVIYKHLDLASLNSVRSFVEDIKKAEYRVDVLINNAGMTGYGLKKTEDGIVTEMQVNHFGHFLLTVLLVPLLKKSDDARVVVVASTLHRFGSIDFKTINKEATWKIPYYGAIRLYSTSKLCNVLFSNELARRLEGTTVTVNSLHPGHVRTSIYKNLDRVTETIMNFLLSTFFKSAVEGAQTSIYLAAADDLTGTTGRFFEECKEARMSVKAEDEELAEKLWNYSAELVKLKPEEAI